MSSNLPPGCGKLPGEEDDGTTQLQEDVWQRCEDAGFSEERCQRVADLIYQIEAEMQREADADFEKRCAEQDAEHGRRASGQEHAEAAFYG